jgi:methionyl aminopeptidase
MNVEEIKKAGQIAREVKEYAKELVKPNMALVDIAEKIESKIISLGGKPAFPVNLSINEVAAHYTPSYNDSTIASGLIKVDLGVQINGQIADTSISLDLENSEENKKLIKTAEEALEKATKIIKNGIIISEIGKEIEKEINSKKLQPIVNLSGHSIEPWNLHAGITIPNYDTNQKLTIKPGLYAIEPFVTSGLGKVKDGKPSGIYVVKGNSQPREIFVREILKFIKEEYSGLPFCSRWLVKKFGTKSLLALKRLEESGILYQYSQLVEYSGRKVAQAEHTILITDKEKIITT